MAYSNEHIDVGLGKWLKREFVRKKFISPAGIAVLVLFAVGAGYLAAHDLVLVTFGLGALLIGIFIVYCCIFKPLVGFYISTFISFFLFYPDHLLGIDFHLSSGWELLALLLFAGTYLSVKNEGQDKSDLMKNAISIGMICSTVYFLIEVFNPNVPDIGGWLAAVKRVIIYFLLYVLIYRLIDTPAKLRYYIWFWLVLSFVAALYGCYQQYFGYLPSEMRFINTHGEFSLLNQGGLMRKFSFLSDVVSFGVLCGSMATMALLLGITEKNWKKKATLFFFMVVLLLGMAYSGTRTTTIMVPCGIALYGLLTIQNKTTVIALFIAILAGLFLLFAPIDNPTLYRIRTSFDTKEESMKVRDRNRHYIQPYIHNHPIGGGVNTCGREGKEFYPTHPLAGFPPDSGLMKTAMEMGWLGLIVVMGFNLMILYQGIFYYFKMKDPQMKIYMAVLVSTLFPIIVSQYSQVTIGQLPGAIFFFCTLSLMKRLMEFDDKITEQRRMSTVSE